MNGFEGARLQPRRKASFETWALAPEVRGPSLHCSSRASPLAARNRPDDDKRLFPGRDRVGQWRVRRLMGQIFLAGEEPQERPALLRDLVADRPAQHRIVRFERVDNRTLRDRALDIDLDFAGY